MSKDATRMYSTCGSGELSGYWDFNLLAGARPASYWTVDGCLDDLREVVGGDRGISEVCEESL